MRKLLALASVGALAATVVASQPASAVDEINTKKLRDAVTVGGVLGHERVLQRIANQNGGTRASGTPGYAASAAYVKDVLKKAGLKVSEQEFTFPFFRNLAEPTLSQVSPTATDYETATFTYSGSGDVTGTLVPANTIAIPPGDPGTTQSGCTPGDFTPAPAAPSVALVQRGFCDFGLKAANAAAAGYDAVVIFNEGQPGRTELLTTGTLGVPATIPVVAVSYDDGVALFNATEAGPVTVAVSTLTETDLEASTTNVFGETKGGDPNKVVVVGAHLDSVVEGPGINDNGSGTSALLEIATQIKKLKLEPRQKIRFAFWGAEEAGLLGSEHYVATLPDAQLAKIYANLNFDMLGSTNYVRFVYDGDGSDSPDPSIIPAGSGEIEKVFTSYFASQGLATSPTDFDGRSDYGPFIAVGIPAGGLFSGAEGIKTAAEAATYGGTAGAPYDPCYHQACDTTQNLSTKALGELTDGAADAVWTLAKSKSGLFEDGSRIAAAKKVDKATALKAAKARSGTAGHATTR